MPAAGIASARVRYQAAVWVGLALSGCADAPMGSEPTPTGRFTVAVTMHGLLPSRTVSVIVNDTLPLSMVGPGTPDLGHAPADPGYAASSVVDLPSGVHRVRVTGLEPNCEASPVREVQVIPYSHNFAAFEVRCSAGSLGDPGLAYIPYDDTGWGNSFLVMLEPGGAERVWEAESPSDIAWSERGDRLAFASGSEVRLLDEQGRLLPGSAPYPGGHRGAPAIAWVPGRDAISMLELSPGGCRVLVGSLLLEPAQYQVVPCAGRGSQSGEWGGDLAWSPDGQTMAVSSHVSGTVSLTSVTTGAVVTRSLPDPLFTPVSVAWRPGGETMAVAGLCEQPCAPDQLALFLYDVDAGDWSEVARWPTARIPGNYGMTTLEFIDPQHLALGPIFGSAHLVSLDAPSTARPLMGGFGYRVSRRPEPR